MKWMLLSISMGVLLSGCATTASGKNEFKAYCPDAPEWPSDVTKPKVVKQEAPPAASRYGTTRACLAVQIDEAGNVTDVQVVRTDSQDFGSASAAAVKRWHFEPARRGSTPVAVTYHLIMNSMKGIGPPPKELLGRAGERARPASREGEVLVFNTFRTGGEAPPRALEGCEFLGPVSATVPEVQGQSIGIFNPAALLPTIRGLAARKSADTVLVAFAPGASEYGRRTLRGTAFRCGDHPLPAELGEPLR